MFWVCTNVWVVGIRGLEKRRRKEEGNTLKYGIFHFSFDGEKFASKFSFLK